MTTLKQLNTISRFSDLIAWQKAYELVLSVYKVSADFPPDERFCLTQQMRRAAISITSNIAEGWSRRSRADYLHFLDMARGSSYELQTQLWISRDLGYVTIDHKIFSLTEELQRVLHGLMKSLRPLE